MKIYGSKVIGTIRDIPQLVKTQDVGLIILADFQTAAHQYHEFRELANFKPARVVVAPDIFGSLSGWGITPPAKLLFLISTVFSVSIAWQDMPRRTTRMSG